MNYWIILFLEGSLSQLQPNKRIQMDRKTATRFVCHWCGALCATLFIDPRQPL